MSDSGYSFGVVLVAIAWASMAVIGALALAGSAEFEKAVIGMLLLMTVVIKVD